MTQKLKNNKNDSKFQNFENFEISKFENVSARARARQQNWARERENGRAREQNGRASAEIWPDRIFSHFCTAHAAKWGKKWKLFCLQFLQQFGRASENGRASALNLARASAQEQRKRARERARAAKTGARAGKLEI